LESRGIFFSFFSNGFFFLELPYSLEYKTHSNARQTPNFITQFKKKKFNCKTHPKFFQITRIQTPKSIFLKKMAKKHPYKRRFRIFSSSTTSKFDYRKARVGFDFIFRRKMKSKSARIFLDELQNSKVPFTRGAFEFSKKKKIDFGCFVRMRDALECKTHP